MVDKLEFDGSENRKIATFGQLQAASYGRSPFASKDIFEFKQPEFVPKLVFASAGDPTPQQRSALRYYEETKFPGSDEDKSILGNSKARELARKNILLHQDNDPTIKDGRIIAVNLPDRAENAQLRAWLLFPLAYKGCQLPGAREQREAFRLAMKKEGFEVTENGIKEIAPGLSPGEQLKLDCLTFKILSEQKKLINRLDPFEQKALENAAQNLNQALAANDPKEFIQKFKNAFALCKDSDDFKTFLIGVTELLNDDKNGKPLIDSFEKLFVTRYSAALDEHLYKDPERLKKWLAENAPEALKKFPQNADSAALLAWLRSLHAKEFSDNWRNVMAQFPDPKEQGAMCDLTCFVLGKKDRFGSAAGLFAALNDVSLRKKGPNTPPDIDQTAKEIEKAENDPGRKSSKAREPGEFIPNPIVLPPEADPTKSPQKWPWYTWVFGVPLAYLIARRIPIVNLPIKLLEHVTKYGIRRFFGESKPETKPDTKPGDTEKLRDDQMSQERTQRGFRDGVVFRAINGLDIVGDSKGAGEKLTGALTDFAIGQTLDPRLLDGRLKISVRFGEAGEPTNGFEKGRLNVTTSGDKTSVELVFPPDASRTEIAADCYLLLYEIERNGKAPDRAFGKTLSVPEQKAVKGQAQVILFTTDMARTSAPGGDVAATVGDRVPLPTGGDIPVIKVNKDGVSIEETKIASKDLLTDLSKEYEKAIKEMERKGEGDSEQCKEAKKMKAEIDGALADMNSKDTAIQDRGSTRGQAVIERHLPKPGSPAHALLLKDLKDARARGGGADATRSRAVVVTMLLRAFIH